MRRGFGVIWHENHADLALDRQRALLQVAEAQRLASQAPPGTPHYREWLARLLVTVALRLSPSLRLPTAAEAHRSLGSQSSPSYGGLRDATFNPSPRQLVSLERRERAVRLDRRRVTAPAPAGKPPAGSAAVQGQRELPRTRWAVSRQGQAQ
jgi:hypothetical protein